jgi:hypothetical protein
LTFASPGALLGSLWLTGALSAPIPYKIIDRNLITQPQVKSSQVNTLPKAKSKTRSKQNKDMHKCSSVYSERECPSRF